MVLDVSFEGPCLRSLMKLSSSCGAIWTSAMDNMAKRRLLDKCALLCIHVRVCFFCMFTFITWYGTCYQAIQRQHAVPSRPAGNQVGGGAVTARFTVSVISSWILPQPSKEPEQMTERRWAPCAFLSGKRLLKSQTWISPLKVWASPRYAKLVPHMARPLGVAGQ